MAANGGFRQGFYDQALKYYQKSLDISEDKAGSEMEVAATLSNMGSAASPIHTNPNPETRNPKPETRNPKPET